jgi:hypothetical protein
MNTKLIDSLVQVIHALPTEERAALTEQLFFGQTYPATKELTTLALQSGSFDFLAQEPDIYSLEDGEPISTQTKLLDQSDNPWLAIAGNLVDDPFFDEYIAAIEQYREELDQKELDDQKNTAV